MREIKFRAWDNKNGRYFEPVHRAYEGDLEDLMIGMSGQLFIHSTIGIKHESCFPDRFILEQFTGLKDKNGVEIYEGDVVHADYSEWHWDATVEWDAVNPCFMMNKIGGNPSWEYDFNKCDQMELEVIGNIHQNPELLK